MIELSDNGNCTRVIGDYDSRELHPDRMGSSVSMNDASATGRNGHTHQTGRIVLRVAANGEWPCDFWGPRALGLIPRPHGNRVPAET